MSAPVPRPTTVCSSVSHVVSKRRAHVVLRRTHLNRFDFTIHKLVLSSRPFQSVLRQVHWISSVVNVGQYLHRYACCKMRCHVIKPRQVPHYFVSTRRTENGENLTGQRKTYTRSPTCLPVPGSFVESFTTVVPRLYNAFASPIKSCSRSP